MDSIQTIDRPGNSLPYLSHPSIRSLDFAGFPGSRGEKGNGCNVFSSLLPLPRLLLLYLDSSILSSGIPTYDSSTRIHSLTHSLGIISLCILIPSSLHTRGLLVSPSLASTRLNWDSLVWLHYTHTHTHFSLRISFPFLLSFSFFITRTL